MSTSGAAPQASGRRPEGSAPRRRHDEVPSITNAQEPLADDQARRMRRYLFQMGFRVVCFLGAYAASGWLRWTLVVVAVVIPYIAVILVNAGRDRAQYDVSGVVPQAPRELPAATQDAMVPDGVRVVVDPDPKER